MQKRFSPTVYILYISHIPFAANKNTMHLSYSVVQKPSCKHLFDKELEDIVEVGINNQSHQ